MNDDIKRLIDIIDNLENRINSYWNFYVVVVLATIGWLMTSDTPFTIGQGVVLTLALSLFFTANLLVLSAVTKRIVAFELELNATAANSDFRSGGLKNELSHPTMHKRLPASYFLHALVDVSVIYAIWSKLG